MATDGDRLFKAILDCPSDPLPRLLLADWLEDRDDPRASRVRALDADRLWVGFTPPAVPARVRLDRRGDMTFPASAFIYCEGGGLLCEGEFSRSAFTPSVLWSPGEVGALPGFSLALRPQAAVADYTVSTGDAKRYRGRVSRYDCEQAFKRQLISLLPEFERPGKRHTA